MNTVLFLCTGNYYRSRFAEHYFNMLAEKAGADWRADSRGLAVGRAGNIGRISPFAAEGLAARGIALDGDLRFPRQVTADDLANARLIVAMKESEHRGLLAAEFPDWADRTEYWRVDDLDCAWPGETLADLEEAVAALLAKLQIEGKTRQMQA
jgi:protein-tyrosine phosphatase